MGVWDETFGHFSKAQIRHMLAFTLLMVLIWAATKIWDYHQLHQFGQLAATIEPLPPIGEEQPAFENSKSESNDLTLSPSEPIPFNKAKFKDLLWAGFTQDEAAQIMQMRSQGQWINSQTDWEQIKFLSTERKTALATHFIFEDGRKKFDRPFYSSHQTSTEKQTTLPTNRNERNFAPKASPQVVELNTADSLSLLQLRGIGPYFARQILLYRSKLGGFHSTTQLLEVYRMSDSLFTQIAPWVEADASKLRKININIEDSLLTKHPYARKGIAKRIIQYRQMHGKFRTFEELKAIYGISQDDWQKLKPYLTFE